MQQSDNGRIKYNEEIRDTSEKIKNSAQSKLCRLDLTTTPLSSAFELLFNPSRKLRWGSHINIRRAI